MLAIHITFGKDATQKFINNQLLSQEEIQEIQKSFAFETDKEPGTYKTENDAAVDCQELYVLEKALRFGNGGTLGLNHNPLTLSLLTQ